jgi:hypothetical protein
MRTVVEVSLLAVAALGLIVALSMWRHRRRRSGGRHALGRPIEPAVERLQADEPPAPQAPEPAPLPEAGQADALAGMSRERDRLAAALADANARVEALSGRLAETARAREIEVGEIESAAVRALDQAYVTGESRLDDLRDRMERLRGALNASERQVWSLRCRQESLSRALSLRDEHIAELRGAGSAPTDRGAPEARLGSARDDEARTAAEGGR